MHWACWSSCLSASFSFCLVVSSWNWCIISSVLFSALAVISSISYFTLAWLLPISLSWVAISSSSLMSCLCCSWSSSHLSLDFTQVTTYSCLRAMLKFFFHCSAHPCPHKVMRDMVGTECSSESGTKDDRQCSPTVPPEWLGWSLAHLPPLPP